LFSTYIGENNHLLETEGFACALYTHQEELIQIASKFKIHKMKAI